MPVTDWGAWLRVMSVRYVCGSKPTADRHRVPAPPVSSLVFTCWLRRFWRADLDWAGFSVTIPHKRAALEGAQEVDPVAHKVGRHRPTLPSLCCQRCCCYSLAGLECVAAGLLALQ
jgi:hypothetical protein